MNRIKAVVLTLACAGVFCLLTEAAPEESTLEVWTASDMEDALGFLGENVPISGKSGCVAKVKAGKNRLSARLRKKDKAYKAAYNKLKAADKASRAQYALTKQALNHKVANAASSCKHKLAAKLQVKDAKYMAARGKLMKKKKTVAAQAKFKKNMAALKKLFHAAIKGKSSGQVKAIRGHFSHKFKALKQASTYYQQAHKLRRASAWYAKYKSQKGAYVRGCKKSVRRDVMTALRLLKGKSRWYKDYENLIAKSAWYKQYKAAIAKALRICSKSGKSQKAKKAMHAALKKAKAKKKKAKKKKESKEAKAKAKAKRHHKRIARRAARHAKLKKALKNMPYKVKGKISDAIARARAALSKAKTPAEKAAAKKAVKQALADAGVVDADNAGTIAWAKHSLDMASKWADTVNAREARSLSKVSAWKPGQRKTGLKMRKSCERVVQAMVAVAHSTRNAAMVTREAKRRHLGKLKSFNAPIKAARRSSHDAEKAVQNARAAMAATLGTKSRIAAHHALARAEDAVHDANSILKMEVKKKNVVTANRLQATGAKLVGENQIHYEARKTFHEANRVLKLVESALNDARKNHYSHKEATMKQQQKVTMEAASKIADKERTAKSEAKRKKLGYKTKEEYAAYLAKAALKFGEVARDDAKKAAKAGKLAAEKAEESAHVKEKLGVANVTSTSTVTEALQRENIASDLAAKAAKMEDAIVTGGKIPTAVASLITDDSGKVRTTMFDEARARAARTHSTLESDEDFHEFATHRKRWMNHYKEDYEAKLKDLEDPSSLPDDIEDIES